MLHQPVQSEDEGVDHALKYRTRVGVRLFLVYALVYGLFVAINLVSPLAMEKIVLLGMNLAITYGIGLILFAFVLALIYNKICARMESDITLTSSKKKAN